MATRSPIEPIARRGAPRALSLRRWDGACPGCRLVLPAHDGPKHVYLGASAACWDLYQQLARPATERAETNRLRRLVMDAYAAQHPGVRHRRSLQSVAMHLMGLCVQLERGGEIPKRPSVLGRMPPRRTLDLHWLEPPERRGRMTIADAMPPDAGERRTALVEAWAREVWAAWDQHHATVRRWLDATGPGR